MLKNKEVILGISGGIAAYKAAELASKLTQAGATVKVVMTWEATQLVQPLTFQALTGSPVVTDMFEPAPLSAITHVSLADEADIVVIVPATANIIAKIAAGIADDILTCTVLATKAPIVISPAMHHNMYVNPVTQENIGKLKSRGFTVIPAVHGRLASGSVGFGRLPQISEILGIIQQILGKTGDLAGKKIVVTAGGTQEAIDPVRYITNNSSGKMGYAIAEAARDRGAAVTLITTPTGLNSIAGVGFINVRSAKQMKDAVVKAVAKTDVLIMAAAVADYAPKTVAAQKIKKAAGGMTLELVKTPDILSEVKGNFIKVGFAAETQDLVANAKKKLVNKSLDIIVANDVTVKDSGFGADSNKVVILKKDGKIEDLPLMSKREVAEKILDNVCKLLRGKK
jgi:phosphopantothenoylcysteine decarboxylase/phosphopantothenate--cysteine ligase